MRFSLRLRSLCFNVKINLGPHPANMLESNWDVRSNPDKDNTDCLIGQHSSIKSK